jgi:hypothetical protein
LQSFDKPVIADGPLDGLSCSTTDFGIPAITGKAVGRTGANEATCFINNMDIGFQFAVAGWMAYSQAMERGIGLNLPTDWFTEDVAG